ncbi:nuclear transport factor 2 family protein [Epilithonimonas sp. JDS]|uniref:nuclear transport factor 2 family protein n=1 Tax=Epilithonimonas sp. JDS TaxID=2902797 RepID=UPI001E5A3EA3|nr:nuclear transport factor 2 family protein [Epilithonimonas sp. JDS]MCD9853142.1 nuclear transport factor 2 family protein [Epilithonimonas sp. JDS]
MKLFALFFILISSFVFSQTSEEELIKSTVNSLFNGMKTSDSSKITKAFSKTAILQTITKNGEVKNENIKDFAVSISKAEKGSLDERITFSNILIDGNLASVWTPYEFYYQGKFSHCGVNSFQLVKVNDEWKIQYIIDTRRIDNCKK